jgi:hypothetical protein
VGKSPRWSKYHLYNKGRNFIQQESTFWKRNLWKKSGSSINTQYRYAGDYDLWLRFFDHEQLFTIPCIVGGFRERASKQLSLDHFDDYLSEMLDSISKKEVTLTFSEKVKSKIIIIDKICTSIPKIREMYLRNKFDQTVFSIPNTIQFNRFKQIFEFKY